jgi:hypothetical protein
VRWLCTTTSRGEWAQATEVELQSQASVRQRASEPGTVSGARALGLGGVGASRHRTTSQAQAKLSRRKTAISDEDKEGANPPASRKADGVTTMTSCAVKKCKMVRKSAQKVDGVKI